MNAILIQDSLMGLRKSPKKDSNAQKENLDLDLHLLQLHLF